MFILFIKLVGLLSHPTSQVMCDITYYFLNWKSKLIEKKENIQKISVSLTIVTSLSVNLKAPIEKYLMSIITDLVLFFILLGK